MSKKNKKKKRPQESGLSVALKASFCELRYPEVVPKTYSSTYLLGTEEDGGFVPLSSVKPKEKAA